MKIQFVEVTHCPLCSGCSFVKLLSKDKFKHGLTTVRCDDCLLVFTNPMPSEEYLNTFYQKHYRKYYTTYSKPNLKYIKRLHFDVRARYHAAFLNEMLPLSKMECVVDVGAGEGSLLNAIRKYCPQQTRIVGVEPGEGFSEFALQQGYYDEVLPDVDELEIKAKGKVLISLVHVLEHVLDPVGFLSTLRKKLKPGDYLFIDVPNVSEYMQIWEIHIAHLYHFDKETLSACVGRSGFSIRSVEEHEPPRHPKSIRILCEASDIDDAILNEIKKSNKSERSQNILSAFKRVNDSAPEYFSIKNHAKRIMKRQLEFARKLVETV